MDGRAIDTATARLHELRWEASSDVALSGAVLALSLVATQVVPELALPLFLGAVTVALLGVRAAWRRWEIVDELAVEPDAYVIREVRARAMREASMERRHVFAAHVRGWLADPRSDRVRGCADDLAALAVDLDDEALVLDPACAVACAHLLEDPRVSPLLDPAIPQDVLKPRVRRIRAGFEPKGPQGMAPHAPAA